MMRGNYQIKNAKEIKRVIASTVETQTIRIISTVLDQALLNQIKVVKAIRINQKYNVAYVQDSIVKINARIAIVETKNTLNLIKLEPVLQKKLVKINAKKLITTTETEIMVPVTIEAKEITIVTHNSILINIVNSTSVETHASRITISTTTNIFSEDPVRTVTGDRPDNTTDNTCSISKTTV
jgi:hypothetical protein